MILDPRTSALDPPARVCVYSHTYVLAANHAKLAHLARMPGIDLSLICPRRVRREILTVDVQRVEHPDYAIVPLRSVYPSHNYRFFYWGAGRALARLRPDLIHIEEEPWSVAAWQAVRHRRRNPHVKLVLFTWENLRRRYGWPHDRIERRVLSAVDAAIAGNAEAADILRGKGFSGPVHVLPQLGVDPESHSPRDEQALRDGLGLHGMVVGYAGRLVREKGVDLLLDALDGLDGDWSLLLLGRGALGPQIEARLRQAPFAGRAALLDTVPRDEMPRHLNCMDVLVLPSREAPHWKEQFGHVLIEAMACGVAVVGSTCGEIPNVIGDAGLVFPEEDGPALRGALASLLAAPERRADLAARGRQRALDCYTDARIAQATRDIWREVLGR